MFKEGDNDDVLLYCSLLILSIIFVCDYFGFTEQAYFTYAISGFTIIACGLALVFVIKNSIRKTYIERLKRKEIEECNDIINENEQIISNIKQENSKLASQIHRDNKVITAITKTAKEMLMGSPSENQLSELIQY